MGPSSLPRLPLLSKATRRDLKASSCASHMPKEGLTETCVIVASPNSITLLNFNVVKRLIDDALGRKHGPSSPPCCPPFLTVGMQIDHDRPNQRPVNQATRQLSPRHPRSLRLHPGVNGAPGTPTTMARDHTAHHHKTTRPDPSFVHWPLDAQLPPGVGSRPKPGCQQQFVPVPV